MLKGLSKSKNRTTESRILSNKNIVPQTCGDCQKLFFAGCSRGGVLLFTTGEQVAAYVTRGSRRQIVQEKKHLLGSPVELLLRHRPLVQAKTDTRWRAAGLRELLVVDTSAGSGKSIGIAAEVKVKTKTPAPTFLEDPVFPSSKSSWNPKPEKNKARRRKTSKAFLIQSS